MKFLFLFGLISYAMCVSLMLSGSTNLDRFDMLFVRWGDHGYEDKTEKFNITSWKYEFDLTNNSRLVMMWKPAYLEHSATGYLIHMNISHTQLYTSYSGLKYVYLRYNGVIHNRESIISCPNGKLLPDYDQGMLILYDSIITNS